MPQQDHNTATRLLGVVKGAVKGATKSGANIEITYGQVFGLTGGMQASVYLAGARELSSGDGGVPEPSEGFRIPAHLTVAASDYVRVSMDDRGHRWIEEVFPTSEYPQISIDVERGYLLAGDGTVPPTPVTFGGGGGGLTTMWTPIGASSPHLVTTTGEAVFVNLTTEDGQPIMGQIVI